MISDFRDLDRIESAARGVAEDRGYTDSPSQQCRDVARCALWLVREVRTMQNAASGVASVDPTDLRALPPTIPIWPTSAEPDGPALGPILGLGRSKTYELSERDEFPIRLLKIGTTYRVSRADLLRYLGETP